MEEIGNILPKAFQKHVLHGKQPVLQILTPLWPRMVGKLIGAFSRPVAFEDGVLTIAASSPTWVTQLEAMSDPICAQVNGSLGVAVVKRLRFRPDRPDRPDRLDRPEKHATARFSGVEDPSTGSIPAPQPSPGIAAFPWADRGVNLAPELAEVVERSFIKYFSRHGKGSRA